MRFEDLDMQLVIGGAATGGLAAFAHALIAGFIISPLMWGSLFYREGSAWFGAMLLDVIPMLVLGHILGAVGAVIAIQMKEAGMSVPWAKEGPSQESASQESASQESPSQESPSQESPSQEGSPPEE